MYHSNPGKYALVSYDFVCSIRRLDDLDTLHLACINQVVRLTPICYNHLSLSFAFVNRITCILQEVSTTLDLLEMVCVNTLKNPLMNFDNNENIVKARSMNTALEEKLRGLMV